MFHHIPVHIQYIPFFVNPQVSRCRSPISQDGQSTEGPKPSKYLISKKRRKKNRCHHLPLVVKGNQQEKDILQSSTCRCPAADFPPAEGRRLSGRRPAPWPADWCPHWPVVPFLSENTFEKPKEKRKSCRFCKKIWHVWNFRPLTMDSSYITSPHITHITHITLGGSTGCASRLMTVAPWHLQTVGVSHLDVDRLLRWHVGKPWDALGLGYDTLYIYIYTYIYILHIYQSIYLPIYLNITYII